MKLPTSVFSPSSSFSSTQPINQKTNQFLHSFSPNAFNLCSKDPSKLILVLAFLFCLISSYFPPCVLPSSHTSQVSHSTESFHTLLFLPGTYFNHQLTTSVLEDCTQVLPPPRSIPWLIRCRSCISTTSHQLFSYRDLALLWLLEIYQGTKQRLLPWSLSSWRWVTHNIYKLY